MDNQRKDKQRKDKQRKEISRYDFSIIEFYDIDAIIMWLNEKKHEGATHLNFSNVVKCRAMYLSEDDDLKMSDDDRYEIIH